ncbi:tRNA 2-thiouridine(34) synthase MnmA [Iamia sp. SCSIO 61187]|uniref:tRNA 2-thiouridine(34) synthase MnmA n=1 Tax=Iamia sp. SCSIO 61187 TaxID=2722752 RepID=UPI001C624F28|nr:tRNA 2-thiouridine(34) synthase MnmA [Iamia sp. SCSIO 61187]QYG94568.1 tRNA 2-thiouridine(34) synthase MnmA [Iamia sp. SCSIO 61187]
MRVLVAMSGGVDSSVAAARLVAAGHEVEGATLKLWGGASDTGCCSVADADDARRVADRLGIDHHTFAYADEFEAGVVGPYVAAHAAGATPNPCMACNREVKFGALLDRADRLGFAAVATGHHARVVTGPDGVRRVGRGADGAKDQSYVLAGLDHDRLGRVLFPVGSSTKGDVRGEAAALGLVTAAKPDSQDVCFITRTDGRARFLGRRLTLTTGRVVDGDGRELGTVPAVEAVTIGQRRGLGLPGGTAPRYVVATDPSTATVVVGSEADLRVGSQAVADVGWSAGPLTGDLVWQVSAHGTPRVGRLVADGAGARVHWRSPERRVAPGQALVAYDGDVVVAWATARPDPDRHDLMDPASTP